MAREFVVSSAATVTGSTTMVFINPPGAPSINVEVLRNWVGFMSTATSAQQQIRLHSQVVGFPLVAAATPAKLKRQEAVSTITGGAGTAGTAGTNSTSESTGASTQILDDSFNVLNGWLWVATPPETIVFPAGSLSGFGMKFPTTPSPLGTFAFGTTFREV